ncbi:MAG: glycosyltransferase [Cyanothece sp. SIO1E1]|nr:glycosyltransferase [Cyanothece sp. SIO1E1]
MKSVLYIGVGVPWQGGAGYLVRQNMLLKALAECAHLHLAMFDCEPDLATVPPFVKAITPLHTPIRSELSRMHRLLNDLFSPLPRMHQGYALKQTRAKVRSLNLAQFEAIFAYRIDFARFAGVERNPRLILDIDDPEHLRRANGLKVLQGHDVNWRTRLDLYKLKRFECNIARQAQATFICQEHDAASFTPHTPIIIPNCIDVPDQIHRYENKSPTLLFIGNMSGGPLSPNGDAVKWFLCHIWPRIYQRVPNCKFQLVGRMSEPLQRLIQDEPNVEALGFVDALVDVYANSWLSIAPIRYGTGTRIKILESLAYGCPVVSTPKGCEGIAVKDNINILMSNSEADFANACVSLIQDEQKRHRLGQAGRQLIANHYNRHRQHHVLVDELTRVLS